MENISKSVTNEQIRTAIKKLAGTFNRDSINFVVCTVTNVNDNNTINCKSVEFKESDATEFNGVLLNATSGDGLTLIPRIDSEVIITSVGGLYFVAMFSELENVILTTNENVQINSNQVVFNDGLKGGLIVGSLLLAKLNALENAINQMATEFNSHTHIITAPTLPSATPLPLSSVVITPSTLTEIENLDILQ